MQAYVNLSDLAWFALGLGAFGLGIALLQIYRGCLTRPSLPSKTGNVWVTRAERPFQFWNGTIPWLILAVGCFAMAARQLL